MASRILFPVLACLALLALILAQSDWRQSYEFGSVRLRVPGRYLAAVYPPPVPGGSTAIALHITLNEFDPHLHGGFSVLALLSYRADLATDQPLLAQLKKAIDPARQPHVDGHYAAYDLTGSQAGNSLYLTMNNSYPGFFTCRHPVSLRDQNWPMDCEVIESLGAGPAAKMANGHSLVVLDYFVPKDHAAQMPEIDARLRALIGGFETL